MKYNHLSLKFMKYSHISLMLLEAVEVDGMMQAGEMNGRLEYMQCSRRDRQHCLEMEEEDLDPKQGSRVGKNSYKTDIRSCNAECRVGMEWCMALLERDDKSM